MVLSSYKLIVSHHSMLKELKVKGDERKNAINSLIRRGICKLDQVTAMDSLANDIFKSLWKKIESSIQSDETEHGKVFSSLEGMCGNRSAGLIALTNLQSDWRTLQGTRVIRLQYGGRSKPMNADDSTFQGVPQIDSTNADYPPFPGGVPQVDPMNADYPPFPGGVPQIDPMNADYPPFPGGVPQVDPMNADYPPFPEDVPQVDPMNADYPPFPGDVPQVDPMNADYPPFPGGVPQVDPMNADYPPFPGGVPQIDPMNADYPPFPGGVPQVDPMNADYPPFPVGVAQRGILPLQHGENWKYVCASTSLTCP